MKQILNPIDHLPRSGGKQGSPPTNNPFAVEALAQAWHDVYVADGRDTKGLAIPEAGLKFRQVYRETVSSTTR